MTFICSISKLFGVLTTKKVTKEICAYLLTIGRITVESHNFTNTPKSLVLTGIKLQVKWTIMKHVHRQCTAFIVMVGRSKSTIHQVLSLQNANSKLNAQSKTSTAHFTTPKKTWGNPLRMGLFSFLNQESLTFQPTSISRIFEALYSRICSNMETL